MRQTLGRILERLNSVAMRETLYAEIDLTDAVVALVKQGHYSGRRARAIPNRAITISRTGVTKRHSLGHLQSQLFSTSVI